MATKAQLLEALIAADAAGEVADAKQLADLIATGSFDDAPEAANAPAPTPPPAAAPFSTGMPGETRTTLNPAEENIAALATGALAAPISGLVGMVGAMGPGPEGQGADWQRRTQEALTYAPKTPGGQALQQQLGEVMAPVTRALEMPGEYLGETNFEASGSPLQATIAKTLPAALANLLGLRYGTNIGRATPDTPAPSPGAPVAPVVTGEALAGREATQNVAAPLRAPEPPPVRPDVPEAPPVRAPDPDVGPVERAAQAAEIDVEAAAPPPAYIDPVLSEQAGRAVLTPEGVSRVSQAVADGTIAAEEAAVVLTPQQLARAATFKRQGVTPLRADITQATDDFRLQQDARKRTGPVSEAVAQQDLQLQEAAGRAIEGTGAQTQSKISTNADVWATTDTLVRDLNNRVNQAYTRAREMTDDAQVVELSQLVDRLRKSKGQQGVTQGLPAALKGELINREILTPDGGLNRAKRLSVLEAEEVRQFLNRMTDPANGQRNHLVREFKDALDEDVAAVVPQDVFVPARAAKQEYHRITERAARDPRDRTRGSFLEDVIANKIPEEQIVDKLKVARADDVQKFKQFLLEDAPQPQGRRTWDNIRGQLLRDALEDATKGAGKTEGGAPVFHGASFMKTFREMGKSRKLSMFFEPAEIAVIRDIGEIARARIPQGNVFAGSGPSGFAVQELQTGVMRWLAAKVPGGDTLMDLATARAAAKAQAAADQKILNPLTGVEQVITAPPTP